MLKRGLFYSMFVKKLLIKIYLKSGPMYFIYIYYYLYYLGSYSTSGKVF